MTNLIGVNIAARPLALQAVLSQAEINAHMRSTLNMALGAQPVLSGVDVAAQPSETAAWLVDHNGCPIAPLPWGAASNGDLDGPPVPLPERLPPARVVPEFPLTTYRVLTR